jgi:hypothetical protein
MLAASQASPTTKDPGKQLPVSAYPPVLTRQGNIVPHWEFVDDFNVGRQAGAREYPFEKVVT